MVCKIPNQSQPSLKKEKHSINAPTTTSHLIRKLIRKQLVVLTYVLTATKPDIAATAGILTLYVADASNNHWLGIRRMLPYIKGILSYGLKFSAHESDDDLYGFADANWAGDVDRRRSTSSYVFMVANGVVSWSSKKQSTVAKSTTEAEYVALSQEAIWLCRLLCDLGFTADDRTLINEKNTGANDIVRNPKFSYRTKDIYMTFHFICEKIVTKEIKVEYCSRHDMIADILTKALPKDRFERLLHIFFNINIEAGHGQQTLSRKNL